jgi:CRP-like cAMP-binding protein
VIGRRGAALKHGVSGVGAKTAADRTKLAESLFRRIEAVHAHSVTDLLECPPATRSLLNASARSLSFLAGEVVFRQSEPCRGLYLVLSGQFLRQTGQLQRRLALTPACAGEMVELAAALGDGHHAYTMAAQTAGSLLLLPIEALKQALDSFPQLRLRLLEELAREVSRAYCTFCLSYAGKLQRSSSAA